MNICCVDWDKIVLNLDELEEFGLPFTMNYMISFADRMLQSEDFCSLECSSFCRILILVYRLFATSIIYLAWIDKKIWIYLYSCGGFFGKGLRSLQDYYVKNKKKRKKKKYIYIYIYD